ncbi:hypothetical protein FDG2_6015 [Candidatus Protofrankia californiensis]|uniref:Metal-dependent HD superfamily phosphohydrolase n=1 Tax=Candidatus Protofrankia californiensis TaxID=1839754 RepID=A0A1C3PGA3_9ACTN|nr:hypothetical protein FDG2_6015 [Candidatus Protofrankia californiensis]
MDTVVLSSLARSFDAALLSAGARADAAQRASVFEDLASRYGEPGRFYHTFRHVSETLAAVRLLVTADWDRHRDHDRDREGGRDRPGEQADPMSAVSACKLAVFFHDAVYDTQTNDNEARSGELAIATLTALGCSRSVAADVDRLVRATATHLSAGPDEAVVNDADLRVLARPAPAYDVYARRVRREYAWVSHERWVSGRAAVLCALLEHRVYATPWASRHWEPMARANLRRELAGLRCMR